MPLKTFVKVGNISNLSDARYCAGMGVDLLGFRVTEGSPAYISPKTFQEIRGWVSGPKVVAEIYGIRDASDLQAIIEQYAPDYFEMGVDEYTRIGSNLPKPIILFVSGGESIPPLPNVEYLIVEQLPTALPRVDILLKTSDSSKITSALESNQIQGIVLDGTPEERPGFKDYASLADVLELLDAD